MKSVHMIAFVLAAVLIASTSMSVSAQKNRKDIPKAPLPALITNAKTVFIVNAGGKDPALDMDDSAELVYDVIYNEFKTWARYQIVDSAAGADLIFVVSYGAENQRTVMTGAIQTGPNTATTTSRNVSDPTLRLAIIDPATKDPVWQTSELREKAFRQKNREKNLIEAAQRLFASFRNRVEPAQREQR